MGDNLKIMEEKKLSDENGLIKRLVIFGILMENNGGTLNKSPEYVLGKYHSAMNVPYPTELLDFNNKAKLARYEEKWINR